MVNNTAKFADIDRSRIRCFAIAPARCTSIDLAVRYSDVIRSVVLQVRKASTASCYSVELTSWLCPSWGQYVGLGKLPMAVGRAPNDASVVLALYTHA